ncbi:Rieske 2Fe-2S domain-containing protein [Rhodobacterales bacterium]|nr:Rieske 2Fe-2S domain-containing protein [Rhodobacterales bacterium]
MNFEGWYPLLLVADVGPKKAVGTRVQGKEFVLWRDSHGSTHVWEDRCPHRGMKMSLGFVRGDHIACLYHGWEYDRGGQCQYIPAHPDLDVPQTIKIPRYPVIEAGSIVWACFQEPDSELPPFLELPSPSCGFKSIFADCPASRVAELIEKTPFNGVAPKVTAKSDRVLEIVLEGGTLTAAVQDVCEGHMAMHMSFDRFKASADQIPYSIWADQLRRDLETAARDIKTSEFAA